MRISGGGLRRVWGGSFRRSGSIMGKVVEDEVFLCVLK